VKTSRRNFLKSATVSAGVFSIVPRSVLGGKGFVPPSDKVNIAIVGAGGQGFVNVKGLLRHDDAQVVAIADPAKKTNYSKFYYKGYAGRKPVASYVDEINEKRKKSGGGKKALRCTTHIDFRKMLDKHGKDIDAVLVATPDHNHAVVSMASLKAGKHTFCEKPLTSSVGESRALANAAKETGLITQMGNYGHCGPGFAAGVEWMRSKNLGDLKEITSWSSAGSFATHRGQPKNKVKKPKSMNDWDLWIGPAEWRDYHPDYAPFKWRGWWNFGGGGLGDMACHNLDTAFEAFHLDGPSKIEVEVDWVDKETASKSNKVIYHCPARGDRPAVKLTWYDGKIWNKARPKELESRRKLSNNGLWARYEKGTILCAGWAGAPRLIPETAMKDFERPPQSLPRVKGGHHRNWLDSIKANKKALADFDYSARLTEFVLLGVIAMRLGKTIEWDADAMKITNLPEANRLLMREYRKGWTL